MVELDRLHLALASSGIALITTDREHRVTQVNPLAESFTGWGASEAIGKPLDTIFRIVHAHTREPAFNPVAHVLHSGETAKLANHTVLIARDGTERHIADSASPMLNGQGGIEGATLVFREVAEDKTPALSLLQEILRIGNVSFDIVDSEFNLHFVDPTWEKVYGDPTGRKCHEYFNGYSEPCLGCSIPTALNTKQPIVEKRVLSKEGNRVVECHTIPYQDEDGLWRVAEFHINASLYKDMEFQYHEYEQRSKTLSKDLPVPICEFLPDSTVTFLNDACCDFFGLGRGEILGKRFLDFMPEDQKERAVKSIEALLPTSPINASVQRMEVEGEIRWIEWRNRGSFGADGGLIKCIGIGTDITARKRAEDALRVFKTATDHALHGIAYSDPDGNLLYINKAFANVHGYEPEELIGKHLSVFHRDKQMEAVRETLKEAFTKGRYSCEEVWHVHRDGHEFPMLMSGVLIRDESGNPSHMAASAVDLTQHYQAQKEKLQLEKMVAVGQLAAGIAHNFNNQLTGVIGYAHLLLSKLTDPVMKGYVENILLGARRSADLTKQMAAFARLEDVSARDVDLHTIVKEVVGILRHTLPSNIHIQQNLLAAPPKVKAEPSQLQNVILNLALNARDAMPDGGEMVLDTSVTELDASYCAKVPYEIEPGTYVCLCVTDTGIGIAPHVLPRIFDPFFTTKEVGQGTGMGLASVYGTIQSLKGAIRVYSEVGHGTTFKLYLPLAKSAIPEPSQPPEPLQAPYAATILLVDDEAVVRSIGEDLLTALGYTVVTKGDGVEGVEYFKENRDSIDLVILDMVMPIMGGRDAYREMRKIAPDVKVLIASGYSLNGEGNQLLAEGALDYVSKPFDLVKFSSSIYKALSGAKG